MNTTFQPLERAPTYLRVSRAIEEKIRDGALPEGAMLPTEAELCDQFGVTRSTVREGIRLLEQKGIVVRGAQKRLRVKKPRARDVAARTSEDLALVGATFREVWECHVALYPQAARLAAQRLPAEGIAALKAICGRLEEETLTGDEVVETSTEFHLVMAGYLDNRVLLATMQSLYLLVVAGTKKIFAGNPKARARIVEALRNLVQAIENRDEDEAHKWMLRHVNDLKRGYAVAGVDLDDPVYPSA